VSRSLRSRARDNHLHVLAVVSAGWFLSLGVRLVYPVLLPYIREAYDFDLAVAGLLLSVLWLAYAVGQLPGGMLADRIGEGRTLVVSSLLTGATLVLVAAGGSASTLFLGTVLLGFATALYGVARFTIIADLFADRVGTATGVTLAAGDAGNAILPPLAGVLAATVAWQAGFGAIVPFFALSAVSLWLVVPASSGNSAGNDTTSLNTARRLISGLRTPSILTGTAVLFLGNWIWQSFTGFYPTYLVEVKGLAPTRAGLLFGGFFAMGILVKPLAGDAYDRFGVRRSLLAVSALMALSLASLPFVHGLGPIVALTALSSAVLGYGTITLTYVTTELPTAVRSTGLGAIRTSYQTVGAASPLIFGALADRGYFDEAFLFLSVLAVVMAALALVVPEP
jgi:MFS family permease